MISRNKAKYLQSLSQKKQRVIHQEFLVEGEKLVLEALGNRWKVKEVYAVIDFIQQHEALLTHQNVIAVTEKDLNQIGNLSNNSRAAALLEIPANALNDKWIEEFVLVLDQVNDPGNLGTIIRTANWFGISTIICSENTVDCYNPKVVQASMGALFSTQVIYQNLNEFFEQAQAIPDYRIAGAYLEGTELKSVQPITKGCLVMGSESHGISPEFEKVVSEKITIPRAKKGKIESLNVGIACGIMCHHLSANWS